MNAERLLALADHLEKGKLGHERFDFGVINIGGGFYECGTAGCAMGELPIAFPDHFRFGEDDSASVPIRKDRHPGDWVDGIRLFFGINGIEMNHLFYSFFQKPVTYGGVMLYQDASKELVASNIRVFVAKKLADTSL